MIEAQGYVETLRTTLEQMKQRLTEYTQMESKVDREISDLYHQLEKTRLSASDGYRFAKQLQTKLRERRRVKGEVAGFLSLISRIDPTVSKIQERIQQVSDTNDSYVADWT